MSSISNQTSSDSPSATPPSHCLLEVCVDSVASALAAERGGAARVELCSGLLDGGVTPSFGLISAVRAAVSIPVMVLIRPRPADFIYDEVEISIMCADIAQCRKIGVAGVVSGALLSDGTIDEQRTLQLIRAAQGDTAASSVASTVSSAGASPPLLFTFHRAFDLTPDLPTALETLVRLQVKRVLTSGGCNDVIRGQENIKVSYLLLPSAFERGE